MTYTLHCVTQKLKRLTNNSGKSRRKKLKGPTFAARVTKCSFSCLIFIAMWEVDVRNLCYSSSRIVLFSKLLRIL